MGGGSINRWSDIFRDVFETFVEAVQKLTDGLAEIAEMVRKAAKAAEARKRERKGWPRKATAPRPATARTSTRACMACAMRWHTAVTGD